MNARVSVAARLPPGWALIVLSLTVAQTDSLGLLVRMCGQLSAG